MPGKIQRQVLAALTHETPLTLGALRQHCGATTAGATVKRAVYLLRARGLVERRARGVYALGRARDPHAQHGAAPAPGRKRRAGMLPKDVALEVQLACARREVRRRQRTYPRLVGDGRLAPRTAAKELAAMQAIVGTLAALLAARQLELFGT